MDGKLMIKKFGLLVTVFVLFSGHALYSVEQGKLNLKEDSILFQNKCGSCHTGALISYSEEVLPSDVNCLVERMASLQGANIYSSEERERIYMYIVNFMSKNRSDEIERLLICMPERRPAEEAALEAVKNWYK
jgi:hypothetical protein